MNQTAQTSRDQAPDATPSSLRIVVAFATDNIAEDLGLDDLAAAAGLTRFSFARRFQSEFGLSPMRWLWQFRVNLAAELIAISPEWSLTDVAFACGFSSSAHFSRMFKAAKGQTATAYKKLLSTAPVGLSRRSVRDALCPSDPILARRAADAAFAAGV